MFSEGQILEFTRDLGGVCIVERGNHLVYLGNSQARILDGPSANWLVTLCVDAPVAPVDISSPQAQ